jgi:hypothetical protein
MVKIFLTVRNRLAITKKCITAIQKHSTMPYQLYVYDNQTNYKLEEHFTYFSNLYEKGLITQITFNTDASTFNAFSKAASCNMFGLLHQQDPEKKKYSFLLILDNDIILTPEWDRKLATAWKHVRKNSLNNIKVIGQSPGGIKGKKTVININKELSGRTGILGGSGLWGVQPNFFEDVGLLNLATLVGHDKKHDQQYWQLLERSAKGKPYILALDTKLGIHCGKMSGSVCNRLTRNRNKSEKEKLELIKFVEAEKKIDSLNFDEFYKLIHNDKSLVSDW